MPTVFSYIIQKRFSEKYEDVATDALAFILHSSEGARKGAIKFLRNIAPDMPNLRFRTQQAATDIDLDEYGIRPDMSGFDDEGNSRVFVENKFWAGLTGNQPVAYLRELSKCTVPTVLLVVAPRGREETLWREFMRRLREASINGTRWDTEARSVRTITTEIGPILALTSWTKLLSALEAEAAEDRSARSDLLQLQALCEAADSDAFIPFASSEVSDQRTPAFLLQLSSLVQSSVDVAVTGGILSIKGLLPQASAERIGRYARFTGDHGVGIWIGTHLVNWRRHGGTPLWVVFSDRDTGRSIEVRSLVEPWAVREGLLAAFEGNELAIAIDLAIGEEEGQVIKTIVKQLSGIADVLSALKARPSTK